QSLYSYVQWDQLSGQIFYIQISKNDLETGPYLYNPATKISRKINLQEGERFVSLLQNNTALISKAELSPTLVANLGDSYAPSITGLAKYDFTTNKSEPISLKESLVQFIILVQPINQNT